MVPLEASEHFQISLCLINKGSVPICLGTPDFPMKSSLSKIRELNPAADESNVLINLRRLRYQCHNSKLKGGWWADLLAL
jgi:hypothetical protein